MKTLNDEVSEWTLPAGSTVKIGGIPYTLASETVVLGVMPPEQVVPRKGVYSSIRANVCAQQRAAYDQTRKDMDPYRDMGTKALSRLGELLQEAWLESQRTGIPLKTGFDREWVIAALIRASSLRLLEFDTSMGLRVPMADGHVLYLALGYEVPDRESGAESSPEAADSGPSI